MADIGDARDTTHPVKVGCLQPKPDELLASHLIHLPSPLTHPLTCKEHNVYLPSESHALVCGLVEGNGISARKECPPREIVSTSGQCRPLQSAPSTDLPVHGQVGSIIERSRRVLIACHSVNHSCGPPAKDATLQHDVQLGGELWDAVVSNRLCELVDALEQDLSAALALPPGNVHVLRVQCINGLLASYTVTCSQLVSTKAIGERVTDRHFKRVWNVYAEAARNITCELRMEKSFVGSAWERVVRHYPTRVCSIFASETAEALDISVSCVCVISVALGGLTIAFQASFLRPRDVEQQRARINLFAYPRMWQLYEWETRAGVTCKVDVMKVLEREMDCNCSIGCVDLLSCLEVVIEETVPDDCVVTSPLVVSSEAPALQAFSPCVVQDPNNNISNAGAVSIPFEAAVDADKSASGNSALEMAPAFREDEMVDASLLHAIPVQSADLPFGGTTEVILLHPAVDVLHDAHTKDASSRVGERVEDNAESTVTLQASSRACEDSAGKHSSSTLCKNLCFHSPRAGVMTVSSMLRNDHPFVALFDGEVWPLVANSLPDKVCIAFAADVAETIAAEAADVRGVVFLRDNGILVQCIAPLLSGASQVTDTSTVMKTCPFSRLWGVYDQFVQSECHLGASVPKKFLKDNQPPLHRLYHADHMGEATQELDSVEVLVPEEIQPDESVADLSRISDSVSSTADFKNTVVCEQFITPSEKSEQPEVPLLAAQDQGLPQVMVVALQSDQWADSTSAEVKTEQQPLLASLLSVAVETDDIGITLPSRGVDDTRAAENSTAPMSLVVLSAKAESHAFPVEVSLEVPLLPIFSGHTVRLIGDCWSTIIEKAVDTLRLAFRLDVTSALDLAPEMMEWVEPFSHEGDALLSYIVQHPGSMPTAEVDDRVSNSSLTRTCELYRLHAFSSNTVATSRTHYTMTGAFLTPRGATSLHRMCGKDGTIDTEKHCICLSSQLHTVYIDGPGWQRLAQEQPSEVHQRFVAWAYEALGKEVTEGSLEGITVLDAIPLSVGMLVSFSTNSTCLHTRSELENIISHEARVSLRAVLENSSETPIDVMSTEGQHECHCGQPSHGTDAEAQPTALRSEEERPLSHHGVFGTNALLTEAAAAEADSKLVENAVMEESSRGSLRNIVSLGDGSVNREVTSDVKQAPHPVDDARQVPGRNDQSTPERSTLTSVLADPQASFDRPKSAPKHTFSCQRIIPAGLYGVVSPSKSLTVILDQLTTAQILLHERRGDMREVMENVQCAALKRVP